MNIFDTIKNKIQGKYLPYARHQGNTREPTVLCPESRTQGISENPEFARFHRKHDSVLRPTETRVIIYPKPFAEIITPFLNTFSRRPII